MRYYILNMVSKYTKNRPNQRSKKSPTTGIYQVIRDGKVLDGGDVCLCPDCFGKRLFHVEETTSCKSSNYEISISPTVEITVREKIYQLLSRNEKFIWLILVICVLDQAILILKSFLD